MVIYYIWRVYRMEKAKLETKRIVLFLVITFGLSWGYCFGIVRPLVDSAGLMGVPSVAAQLAVAAMMLFPALGVVLTRLITKEGFGNAWLRPHFRGNLRLYLAAWFGPGILTVLGAALYFLIFPDQLDLSLAYFRGTLASLGALEELPMPLELLFAIQAVQGLLMAPAMNIVFCFGEEWGWRGYLLPKLSGKLPVVPLVVVSGVIWGLWHAPLTAMGHNYGLDYPGFPWLGIAAMCCFCTAMGIFLSWLTLRTGSCLPAILAHGAVNGIAALGVYLTVDGGDPFIGPAPTGIVGAIPLLVVAVLCLRSLLKNPPADR